MVKIRPEVIDALHAWWEATYHYPLPRGGQGIENEALLHKLFQFSLPEEDINDTILRILEGNIVSHSVH